MDITLLRAGEIAKITQIDGADALKGRLKAFGVFVGAEIVLLKRRRKTYLIRAESLIAVGEEVAKCVKVVKRKSF